MITRAYQNASGERQEITLAADQWAALSEADLENMLGHGKKPAKAAKAAKTEEAPAAVVEDAPVAEAAPAAAE